jgi:F-type H+-transporting ATPase subunit gamma
MAKGLSVLRRRITSIKATKKVTKAMQMIATTKLKNWKTIMLESRLYAEKLVEIVNENLHNEAISQSVFFKANDQLPKLYLVVTSNLGLCGSYNYNVLNYLTKRITTKDRCFVIGEKGARFIKHIGIQHRSDFVHAGSLSDAAIAPLMYDLLKEFQTQQIGEVIIIYTKFINSLTFTPIELKLLPLAKQTFSSKQTKIPPLIEPDPQAVFDRLVPLYIKNTIYACLIESQVSEQSSRRNAMEKASDNADDLVQQLQLDFNKQRQANITQEIAEIIGGSST